MKAAKGTVFKYGDNVDTDVIIPARYLNSTSGEELAKHCMEDIDKDFTKNVKAGDKGQITKANQNDSDKGYNEITSGADLVTNQSGNCFGFIEAGNYKVTFNETEKSISIEKVE